MIVVLFKFLGMFLLAFLIYSVTRFVGEEVWLWDRTFVEPIALVFGLGIFGIYLALKIN